MGEMHIRRGRYIGIAPLPGGLTNLCLVMLDDRFWRMLPEANSGRDPAALLRNAIDGDPGLRARFAAARLVRPPMVLGPLAVETRGRGVDGLVFAGDAAGFIDPMTGDGLRFAVCGGELAARAALEALEHGWAGVHARLAERQRDQFAGKRRFNRALRSLVASPRAVSVASVGAALMPAAVRSLVFRAGDCRLTADS